MDDGWEQAISASGTCTLCSWDESTALEILSFGV
jgi:hypothetical protein